MQVNFEAPVIDLRWAGLNHDYDRVRSCRFLMWPRTLEQSAASCYTFVL